MILSLLKILFFFAVVLAVALFLVVQFLIPTIPAD